MPFDIDAPGQVDLLGFLAATLVFASFSMRTMLLLRLTAIASNVAFITYALFAGLTPILVLHGALLPLNLYRLLAMRREVSDFNRAAGDDDFLSLAPLGRAIRLKPGEFLFHKDEAADAMYVVTAGEIEIPEIGVTLGRGALIGEIALYSDDRRRTASARAKQEARVARIGAEATAKLWFDNPILADRMARLIATRLVMRLRRAESAAAQRAASTDAAPEAVPARAASAGR